HLGKAEQVQRAEAEHLRERWKRGQERVEHGLAGARVPVRDSAPGGPVLAERSARRIKVTGYCRAGSIRRWMGAVHRRVLPDEAGAWKIERPERGARLAKGKEGCAQVVMEPGERHL